MAVTWLHVSDFHFGSGSSYDRNVVLDALIEVVERYRKRGRKPDLIFATGDIGSRGQASDYELAGTFFDSLLAAADVEKSRLFIVPGNHDVDRTKVQSLCRTYPSAAHADNEFCTNENLPHISYGQRAFVDWYNQYFTGIRAFSENTTCGPVEVVDVDDIKISVLPLNSALFCRGDDDYGKLWLGFPCLKSVDGIVRGGQADIRIGLIHHPLDWITVLEKAKVKAKLPSVANVILRGHLHDTDVESCAGITGTVLHLAAGAAYQTRDYPNRALYVTVDKGEARVHPIHYMDSPHEKWAPDTSLFPDESNYEGVFLIPQQGGGATGVGAVDGTKTITPSDSHKKEDSRRKEEQRWRFDSDARFRLLKNNIAKELAVSKSAMAALELAMQLPLAAGGMELPTDRERAAALVEALINLTFDQGKAALLAAYDQLHEGENDRGGVAAINAVSSWLIPWLYVASNNILTERWEALALGDVLSLPAGIGTFAEIVMAGIYRRAAAYHAITKNGWPLGTSGLPLAPEGGIADTTAESLRDGLFKMVGSPVEAKILGPSGKDESINMRLESLLKVNGTRFYLVCFSKEKLTEIERQQHQKTLEDIARLYPALAVIKLDDTMILQHQRILEEIQHLLLPTVPT
jgi:predicted phosphodiesterase